MIYVRKSEERGQAEHGWLSSRHTFSFADYHDPRFMGFSDLRVINEDHVAPGGGFPTHPHRDMEIVTYILDGALEHKDSMGNSAVIRPGEVQRMTAGTGVRHSEFNASKADPVHLLQIWLLPETGGLTPGYEQTAFTAAERQGRLRLVASRDGREGSVTIHQDTALYAALLARGETVTHRPAAGRKLWLQVARGAVTANRTALNQGDAVALAEETEITVTGAGDGSENAEILLFDLR
jgi:redox-sensitive bicupin YhaK (pirin superfamily)